jgi:hypothetical protein
MTDLDIEIDVPDDDDGLDTPVRVLNGDGIPPWLKAAAVIVVFALIAMAAGSYLLGRFRSDEDAAVDPIVDTTPLASAEASPAVEHSLEAVEAWERFASDGDLDAMATAFDPAGPQWATFAAAIGSEPTASPAGDAMFAARNLTERWDGAMTTVSMDLLVTSQGATQTYPFDFVFLEDSDRVWTVIDRRSPGSVALPPAPEAITGATTTWDAFTAALAVDDGEAVLPTVSADSQIVADQVAAAAAGSPVDQPLISDPELFDLLVDRVAQVPGADAGEALIALLDQDQRQALVAGELTSWIQTDEHRIVATLEMGGQPVTSVPFVASAEGWLFDLKQALTSSGGGSQ